MGMDVSLNNVIKVHLKMKTPFFALLLMLTCCTFSVAQPIHQTACNGNLSKLDSMLTDTSVMVKDEKGRSLLHWAVACRQQKVIDYLVEKGIDLNALDDAGKSAMHVAVRFNNQAFLEYLIQLQSNSEWTTAYGPSLVELAVLKKSLPLIEVLLTHPIDLNATNQRGSTPLEIAKRIDATEIADLLVAKGADPSLVRTVEAKGPYMGQSPPGTKALLFAPNFLSTEEQEFGCIFSADGTECYIGVDLGGHHEIRYSKLEGDQWTKPKPLITDAVYSYNDPFLSNDENRLYFISNRALDGQGAPKDIDIWYVERIDDGWSDPINAGTSINTKGDEYYISFTTSGTMYFSSNGQARKDTTRKDHDIYAAAWKDGNFDVPSLLGPTVNTTDYEADVFVAPDESYLIFCSTRSDGLGRGDLYISFKDKQGGWTTATNMGTSVNTSNYEYCPFVTKDGKFLFFTSNQDIYWVSIDIIEQFRPER